MAIAKEQLRQIIKENNIQNVGDIYNNLSIIKFYLVYFSESLKAISS